MFYNIISNTFVSYDNVMLCLATKARDGDTLAVQSGSLLKNGTIAMLVH